MLVSTRNPCLSSSAGVLRAQSVAAGAEHRRVGAEAVAEQADEFEQLGLLQRGGQVGGEGVVDLRRLGERRGDPRVQLHADLTLAARQPGAQVGDDGGVPEHRPCQEVGRHRAVVAEDGMQVRQPPHAIDVVRHAAYRAQPIEILFRVDQHAAHGPIEFRTGHRPADGGEEGSGGIFQGSGGFFQGSGGVLHGDNDGRGQPIVHRGGLGWWDALMSSSRGCRDPRSARIV